MARTRRIRVANGRYALLDQRDWRWAHGLKWYEASCSYARRSVWADGMSRSVYMHREIYERILGRKIPKHMVIDHKNRNRFDNRRHNLRLVTILTNNRNRKNVLLWDGERWVYEHHGKGT